MLLYNHQLPISIEELTTAGFFAFYVKEYELFHDVLLLDKNEFSKITAHLAKEKNTYQHNNDDLIDPSFKHLTKGYCELLNKKKIYTKKRKKIIFSLLIIDNYAI